MGKKNSQKKKNNLSPNNVTVYPQELKWGYVYNRYSKGELGDAELLHEMQKGRLAYDHSDKSWYIFPANGGHWEKDSTSQIKLLISRNVAAAYINAAAHFREIGGEINNDKSQKLLKRAYELRHKRRVDDVMSFAQSLCGIEGNEWDKNPDILGVLNGVIDLKTGMLRESKPEDYIRKVASIKWEGIDTPAPTLEIFLKQIFEDNPHREEIISYLQVVLGYGITGHAKEHILPILYGPQGRNGKDTLLKLLEHVLGPHVGPASPDVFITKKDKSSGAAEPHIYDLMGKRMIWVSETGEGDRLNAKVVKYLSGGGRIKTRNVYAGMVEFEPAYLPLLITNHKPMASADDDALWTRVHLIPLTMRFVADPKQANERKVDVHLIDKLKAESSGVLAWLVRGAIKWYKEGLTVPVFVKMATQEYKEEQDVLSLFIEECCTVEPGKKARSQKTYDRYKRWIKEMGFDELKFAIFKSRMVKRFKYDRDSDGNYFDGLALIDSDQKGRIDIVESETVSLDDPSFKVPQEYDPHADYYAEV